MSLRFQVLPPIPEETARVVRGAFRRKGHPYIAFADAFSNFVDCDDFSELYPTLGQSAIHPGQLALASILQAAGGLSDRQAAQAVAESMLWKYVLRLELDHPGWDPSVFSEFRTRLVAGGAERLLFDKLLHECSERGLLKHSKQRTDSTHVLSAAKALSRLELLHETVWLCLEELTETDPIFVSKINKSHWLERYYQLRPFNYKLPNNDKAREKLASEIFEDGRYLLEMIAQSGGKLGLLETVKTLIRVWEEQFTDGDGDPRLRKKDELKPSGERISSPHDPDARFGMKRHESWLGYKVHLTETVDEDAPHLITNVLTTSATVNDSVALPEIHRSLAARGFKPLLHLLDSGYAQIDTMWQSWQHEAIDVVTRLVGGHSWQSKADTGYDIAQFRIEWSKRRVVCPEGKTSRSWKAAVRTNSIKVGFDPKVCNSCPVREQCTTSSSRQLQFKPKPVFEFMEAQRRRQQTADFHEIYKGRAGIEGTISQAVRRTNMRRSPYMGIVKTDFANVMAATAVNFLRIGAFLMGKMPESTRFGKYQLSHVTAA